LVLTYLTKQSEMNTKCYTHFIQWPLC